MYFFHDATASTNIPPNYHKVSPWRCPRQFSAPYALSLPGYNCAQDMRGFKSEHPGGMNMCMGDGSVRFVSETIDYRTWVFLGARSDGEVVSVP